MGLESVLGFETRHEGLLAQVRLLQSDIGESRGAEAGGRRVTLRARPQEGPAQFRVHQQGGAVALADDPAVGQQIGGLRGGQRPGGVLLHQQGGDPGPGQLMNNIEDLVRDQGGQPQAGLVQQQQARPGHQGPAHGHHLLLAPGQGVGALPDPLLELRETGQDLLQAPIHLASAHLQSQRPQLQVLPDREVAEHLPPLGTQGHTQSGHGRRRSSGDLLPVQPNPPAGRRHQTHDGLQQTALPRPIGPHQRHGLTHPHRQIHPKQRLRRPIVHGEVARFGVMYFSQNLP